MAETNQNFSVYAGDDYDQPIILKDRDGARLDLASTTLVWTVSRFPGGRALLTKTSDDATQLEVTDEDAVISAIIHLVQADTITRAPASLYHKVRITDAFNKVETLLTGIMTVRK